MIAHHAGMKTVLLLLAFVATSVAWVAPLVKPQSLRPRAVHIMRGPSQADLDNHANQCNPNNDAYWDSRDEDRPDDWEDEDDDDNRANQLNPNNDAYWDSRDDNRANQLNPNNDAYHESRQ